jgi:hypothetical protein
MTPYFAAKPNRVRPTRSSTFTQATHDDDSPPRTLNVSLSRKGGKSCPFSAPILDSLDRGDFADRDGRGAGRWGGSGACFPILRRSSPFYPLVFECKTLCIANRGFRSLVAACQRQPSLRNPRPGVFFLGQPGLDRSSVGRDPEPTARRSANDSIAFAQNCLFMIHPVFTCHTQRSSAEYRGCRGRLLRPRPHHA